jgi:HK97 family phage major capsid protein
MGITAAKTLSNFSDFLTPEQSAPIFEDAARSSVVQRIVPQVPLSFSGRAVPVVNQRPVATWVTEGVAKTATQGGMKLVNMEPKKLAAIAVVSEEVVRANPGNFVTWLRPALSDAFAVAFDLATLHGVGGNGTGSGPFDADIADTTHTVTLGTGATLYNDLVSAGKTLSKDGRKITAFAFSDYAEWLFADELDGVNRPLFSLNVTDPTALVRPGALINRPCYLADTIGLGTTMGFAGDWTKARWGVVGGINFTVSNEASVTINGSLVSLWQNNLVAIRAEAEYGFVMTEATNFVKFINSGVMGTLGTPGFGTP